jgi:hypothetical protein
MTTPLEVLGETDIQTEWFAGSAPNTGTPADYAAATGGRAEADLAIWRRSVRQRFPPGTHYKRVAAQLGSVPAAGDSPVGEADRLREIGRTREIERYPGETDAQYCERLANAMPAHRARGTPSAIISQLEAFGYTEVEVLEEYNGDLSPGASEYGWRFVVIVRLRDSSLGWPGWIVGSGVVGTVTVGLGTGTAIQIATTKRIIIKWKQVFALPMRLLIIFGDPPIVGSMVVGGMTLGEGTVIEEPMADVRSVGYAIVGDWPLSGFNI